MSVKPQDSTVTSNAKHSSKESRWRTPEDIIVRARRVLGGRIHLDPASDADANTRVQADTYYTDGLSNPWFGAVFCNPPGGRGMAGQFWAKLMAERGNIWHAVFLFFNMEGLQNTQGKPHPAALDFPCCIPAKRLHFLHPDMSYNNSPTHANALVYVPGVIDATHEYVNVFSEVGICFSKLSVR